MGNANAPQKEMYQTHICASLWHNQGQYIIAENEMRIASARQTLKNAFALHRDLTLDRFATEKA
jgi:hypothetical protein